MLLLMQVAIPAALNSCYFQAQETSFTPQILSVCVSSSLLCVEVLFSLKILVLALVRDRREKYLIMMEQNGTRSRSHKDACPYTYVYATHAFVNILMYVRMYTHTYVHAYTCTHSYSAPPSPQGWIGGPTGP